MLFSLTVNLLQGKDAKIWLQQGKRPHRRMGCPWRGHHNIEFLIMAPKSALKAPGSNISLTTPLPLQGCHHQGQFWRWRKTQWGGQDHNPGSSKNQVDSPQRGWSTLQNSVLIIRHYNQLLPDPWGLICVRPCSEFFASGDSSITILAQVCINVTPVSAIRNPQTNETVPKQFKGIHTWSAEEEKRSCPNQIWGLENENWSWGLQPEGLSMPHVGAPGTRQGRSWPEAVSAVFM